MNDRDEHGDDVTLPDPSHGAAPGRPGYGREPADELPPLPTLAPLPVIKPMTPMPQPPWESDGLAVPPPWESDGLAVPPTAPPPDAPPPQGSASGPSEPLSEPHPRQQFAPEPYTPLHSYGPPAPTPSGYPPQWHPEAPAPGVPQHNVPAPIAPQHNVPEPGVPQHNVPEPAAPLATPTAASVAQVGRHGAPGRPVAAAAGRHVLIVGGGEPLGSMIAERLIAAGHLLALADVATPTDISPHHDRDGMPVVTAEPTVLDCDRFDSEEVVRTVARAEVALGGLDALIVLPAGQHSFARLDTDAATWADEWSTALTAEVLAAACASHIAARSFLARRRAGRIILVVDGRETSGAQPASAIGSALVRLGTDLSRELAPHGIGVSVVTAGGSGDFGLGQVADVVEALLATPVLSTVGAHIG